MVDMWKSWINSQVKNLKWKADTTSTFNETEAYLLNQGLERFVCKGGKKTLYFWVREESIPVYFQTSHGADLISIPIIAKKVLLGDCLITGRMDLIWP